MSTTVSRRRGELPRQGLILLVAIVASMWLIEVINTLDHNVLYGDGIVPRDPGRLWTVLSAPFIHASFAHLISNTIPFLFLGAIIALRGAGRLALVTAIVIVLGGVGTWLIAPSHTDTIGASGVVFGYATYLLTRGAFDRSALELATGAVVAIVWGGALLASIVPHAGVSWQAHVCGAVAGVIAAWLLASGPGSAGRRPVDGTRPAAGATSPYASARRAGG